jgi:hypothetical protein
MSVNSKSLKVLHEAVVANTSDFRFIVRIIDKNSKKFKIQFKADCRAMLEFKSLGTSTSLALLTAAY